MYNKICDKIKPKASSFIIPPVDCPESRKEDPPKPPPPDFPNMEDIRPPAPPDIKLFPLITPSPVKPPPDVPNNWENFPLEDPTEPIGTERLPLMTNLEPPIGTPSEKLPPEEEPIIDESCPPELPIGTELLPVSTIRDPPTGCVWLLEEIPVNFKLPPNCCGNISLVPPCFATKCQWSFLLIFGDI